MIHFFGTFFWFFQIISIVIITILGTIVIVKFLVNKIKK